MQNWPKLLRFALPPERQEFEQDVENLRGEMHALRAGPPAALQITIPSWPF